jgi:hypothetical protein
MLRTATAATRAALVATIVVAAGSACSDSSSRTASTHPPSSARSTANATPVTPPGWITAGNGQTAFAVPPDWQWVDHSTPSGRQKLRTYTSANADAGERDVWRSAISNFPGSHLIALNVATHEFVALQVTFDPSAMDVHDLLDYFDNVAAAHLPSQMSVDSRTLAHFSTFPAVRADVTVHQGSITFPAGLDLLLRDGTGVIVTFVRVPDGTRTKIENSLDLNV